MRFVFDYDRETIHRPSRLPEVLVQELKIECLSTEDKGPIRKSTTASTYGKHSIIHRGPACGGRNKSNHMGRLILNRLLPYQGKLSNELDGQYYSCIEPDGILATIGLMKDTICDRTRLDADQAHSEMVSIAYLDQP
jgi:hypothetical protein